MKDYALIRLKPLNFMREMDAPTTTKSGYAVVPLVRLSRPSFDPLRERATQDVQVSSDSVTYGWVVTLKSAEERKGSVDSEHRRVIRGTIGDENDVMASLTNGLMLMDEIMKGNLTADDPQLTPLRNLAAWWEDVRAYTAALKAEIEAGGDPLIEGWPVLKQ